jgi:hypothetical protein
MPSVETRPDEGLPGFRLDGSNRVVGYQTPNAARR